MFGSYLKNSVVVTFDYDPAADDQLPVFVAPAACRIVGAKAMTANDVAANTANYFNLQLVNKGTAGTGTAEIGSAVIGGTAGWSALVPKAWTLDSDNDNLAEGEVVALDYDETGTGTFGVLSVQIDYQLGV